MSEKKLPNPFLVLRKGFVKKYVGPSTIGAVTAAGFALTPRIGGGLQEAVVDRLVQVPGLGRIPLRVYLLLVGFSTGYVVTRCLNWLRWKTLKKLLQYRGWVHNQRSLKTKAWGLLVKLLKGAPPYSTYEFQDILPNQPLPELKDTLERWKSSAHNFLTEEEFASLKQAADEFLVNEGPKLQEYLHNKSNNCVSWLADYWLQAAYLAGRDPLPVNSNYLLSNSLLPERSTTKQTVRGAEIVHGYLKFKDMMDNKSLQPIQLLDLVPICMHGIRYLFGSTRLPGEHMDSLAHYADSEHIVVIRKGQYFKVTVYMNDKTGKKTLLTNEELKIQFDRIMQIVDDREEVLKIADLTTQNRTTWYKHREILKLNNKETLEAVESALFVIEFSSQDPKDATHHAKVTLTGYGGDRWFDKSICMAVFPNGSLLGACVEHSVIDATVFTMLIEHMMTTEKYDPNGDLITDPTKLPRELPKPQKLTWKLAGIEETIQAASDSYLKTIDDLHLELCYPSYGKRFMKKSRISPDGYIQTCLQLAFYRVHKYSPKTYEPATGRLFQLGRTETVHPSSPHTIKFLTSMDDTTVSNADKISFLQAAVKHQTKYRLDGTVGNGCDRHLLGLYCAAREMGMDIPKLFMDKAWRSNFILSTSQTPTRCYEYGVDYLWPYCCGGFGPSCHDGYGVSYVIFGEDIINFVITSWHGCETTDSKKLSAAISKAMDDVKEMLSS